VGAAVRFASPRPAVVAFAGRADSLDDIRPEVRCHGRHGRPCRSGYIPTRAPNPVDVIVCEQRGGRWAAVYTRRGDAAHVVEHPPAPPPAKARG
jgi:hypothetical protein